MRMLAIALAVLCAASAGGGELPRITPQPQDMSLKAADQAFPLKTETLLVVKENLEPGDKAAVELLNAEIERLVGTKLKIVKASEAPEGGKVICIGEPGKGNKVLDAMLEARRIKLDETYPGPEGYVIDVAADGIALAGFDQRGTMYAAATLGQLAGNKQEGQEPVVPGARIFDFPELPCRSAYAIKCGDFAPDRIEKCKRAIERLARLKYNMVSVADRHYAMLEKDAPGQPGKKIHECLAEVFDYARQWHLIPRVEGPAFYFPPGSYTGEKRPAPDASDPTTLAGIRYTQTAKLEGEKDVTLEIQGAKSKQAFPVANVLYDLKTGKSWEKEPVVVTSEDGKTRFEEGKDYAVKFGEIAVPFFTECSADDGQPTVVPRLGRSMNGPTTVKRLPTGAIKDGDSVKISFTYVCPDPRRPGKYRECVADERLLTDGSPENYVYRWCTMPAKYLKPDQYCLSVDENRCLGYDLRSDSSGKMRSQLLADYIKYQYDTIRKGNPKARVLAWSDMLDPNHNGGPYELDKTGSYLIKNGLTDVLMIPWYDAIAEQSLRYLQGDRFGAMPSVQGEGEDQGAAKWAFWLRRVYANKLGRCGLQYTTWDSEKGFSDEKMPAMKAVAQWAWSCGPYIVHRPLAKAEAGKEIAIEARVFNDPIHYRVPKQPGGGEKEGMVKGERPVTGVTLYVLPPGENAYEPSEMKQEGGVWKGSIKAAAPAVKYYIEASDGERRAKAPRAAERVTFEVPVEEAK